MNNNLPDLSNKRYGSLTVIEFGYSKGKKRYWRCICDCGKETYVHTNSLKSGNTTSCGCKRFQGLAEYQERRKAKNDLIGKRFGKLTVIERAGKNSQGRSMWLCQCDCGKTKNVCHSYLTNGDTKSCGCYQSEKIKEWNKKHKIKHGLYYDRIHTVWKEMIERCEKPRVEGYPNYGGRGIRVCEEWHDLKTFADWAYKNGYDPNAKKGECTLERVDVNGNYEPENCIFTDMFEQNCNRRNTTKVLYKGEVVALMKIGRKYGMEYPEYTKLYKKIKERNIPVEEALASMGYEE